MATKLPGFEHQRRNVKNLLQTCSMFLESCTLMLIASTAKSKTSALTISQLMWDNWNPTSDETPRLLECKSATTIFGRCCTWHMSRRASIVGWADNDPESSDKETSVFSIGFVGRAGWFTNKCTVLFFFFLSRCLSLSLSLSSAIIQGYRLATVRHAVVSLKIP